MVIMRRSSQAKWLTWAGFAAILLVGLGAGTVVSRTMAAAAPSRIAQQDYVALVAVLYDREKSLSSAQDRLKILGADDEAKLVSSVASSYVPGIEGQPNDAEPLRQLSIALGRTAPAGQASPTVAAVSTPTGRAETQSSSGVNWPLVIAVALMAVLIIGVLIVVRWMVRPSPVRGFTNVDWSPVGSPSSRRVSEDRVREKERASQPLPRRSELPFGLSIFGGGHRRAGPTETGSEGEETVTTRRTRAGGEVSAVEANRSFASRYRLGDDPFDEVHPILDPSTGLLIGACGLSAALQGKSAEGRGYYAFLVWVHDYLTPQSFKGIGLTTRWRIREKGEGLTSWVQSSMVEDLAAAETGFKTSIRTRHLLVDISLPEVECLPDEEGLPDGYFRSLAIKFEVSMLRAETRTARSAGDSSEVGGVAEEQAD